MKVNIILPCHDIVEHTKLCVESIRKNTYVPYKIIAVDDGSTDGTYEYLRKEGIVTIRHKENLGWWKSLNDGIKHSKADYYALVDRDILVTPNWLSKLIEVFESMDNVGIATGVSNAGPENVGFQCLHAIKEPLIPKFFKSRNPYTPDRIYWLITQDEVEEFGSMIEGKYSRQYAYQVPLYCFCILISRETVEKVGLFNEDYINWYADLEYCYNVVDNNLKIIVRRDTYLHHYKFPPLTKREFDKAPYLRKYSLLQEDSYRKEAGMGIGQFISKRILTTTNKDMLRWTGSVYYSRGFRIKEGSIIEESPTNKSSG